MNFDLSEEQEMLRDGAARFMRDEYGFEHRRHLAKTEEGFSREYWKQYAELGWLALNLPEDVGGLACSFVETAVLMEEFGRGMALEPFLSTVVLGAQLIDRAGSEAHRQELLPVVIGGDLLLALAHDEPGGRGIEVKLRTRAVKTGLGYRLDGQKTLVLAAPSADRLILTTQLENGELALFLIPANSPGLLIKPYTLVDCSRAADVLLEGCEVPADCLLASGSVAGTALDEALDLARLAAIAQSVGAMEACMQVSADYIKQRSQFGQPLAKFQSLQHLMADMFVDAQQSRSMLYQGLASIGADSVRRSRGIAAAKIVVGSAGKRVSGNGVQLHGGYGVTDEYPISHHYRQLFVLDKLFGSAADHARNAA